MIALNELVLNQLADGLNVSCKDSLGQQYALHAMT